MGIVFLIIGLVALLSGLYLLIRYLREFKKDSRLNSLEKNKGLWILVGAGLNGVACAALSASIPFFSSWEMSVGSWFLLIIGALFFGFCLSTFWGAFYIRFYKEKCDPGFLKTVKIVLYSSIPLVIVFFLLWGQGIGDYLTYPLASGISINSNGIHFFTYANQFDSTHRGGVHIAFYAIAILLGYLIAYKVADHRFYKEFGKHGIVDTLLIVVFLSGIIGARLWYVVGNWNGDGQGGVNFSQEVANGNWTEIFAIWNGGLTILGGVAFGIICGVLYMIWKRPYVNVRWALDVIIPAILIGQAIGRWGNFFNHEVYGAEVSMADWSFLPTWIRNQMATSFNPLSETMYVPLFLIECLINLAGYFVIAYGIPAIWKKNRGLGSLFGFYMIWYGVTRMIMEPLRDPTYNMGTTGNWSFWNAMIYVIVGVIAVVWFTLYDYFHLREKWFHNFGRGQKWIIKDAIVTPIELVKEGPAKKPEETPAEEPVTEEKEEDPKGGEDETK